MLARNEGENKGFKKKDCEMYHTLSVEEKN